MEPVWEKTFFVQKTIPFTLKCFQARRRDNDASSDSDLLLRGSSAIVDIESEHEELFLGPF